MPFVVLEKNAIASGALPCGCVGCASILLVFPLPPFSSVAICAHVHHKVHTNYGIKVRFRKYNGCYCWYSVLLTLSIVSDKTAVRGIRGGGGHWVPPLFFSAYEHRKDFVKVSFFSWTLIYLLREKKHTKIRRFLRHIITVSHVIYKHHATHKRFLVSTF